MYISHHYMFSTRFTSWSNMSYGTIIKYYTKDLPWWGYRSTSIWVGSFFENDWLISKIVLILLRRVTKVKVSSTTSSLVEVVIFNDPPTLKWMPAKCWIKNECICIIAWSQLLSITRIFSLIGTTKLCM